MRLKATAAVAVRLKATAAVAVRLKAAAMRRLRLRLLRLRAAAAGGDCCAAALRLWLRLRLRLRLRLDLWPRHELWPGVGRGVTVTRCPVTPGPAHADQGFSASEHPSFSAALSGFVDGRVTAVSGWCGCGKFPGKQIKTGTVPDGNGGSIGNVFFDVDHIEKIGDP
ncbi:hypothetical protein ABZ651_13370, partial [Streptomyces sp. NPDC007070]